MNIIDVQDQLKNFSEQQLISEMQMPSGSAPQFLVLSEIKRRKRVRDDFMKREAAGQPTVAEEAIAAAGVPQSGIMGMSEAMAPQAAVAEGGIGSVMPQSMRPQTMPAPTDDAIPMRSGGLAQFGQELSGKVSEGVEPFLDEVEGMAQDRFGVDVSGPLQGGIADLSRPTYEVARPNQDFMGRIPFMQPSFSARPAVLPAFPIRRGGKGGPRAVPYNEGGVVRAANGLPLGLRQNNPGNIRPGAGFYGETGQGGGYAEFGSEDEGLRALARLLGTYSDKYGINTLRGLTSRYAPRSDNEESFDNYISYLGETLGMDPDEEFDLKGRRDDLIPAIVGFEQGRDYGDRYSDDQIARAIRASGTEDEAEIADILAGGSEPSVLSQLGDTASDVLSAINPISTAQAQTSGPAMTDVEPEVDRVLSQEKKDAVIGMIKQGSGNPGMLAMQIRGYFDDPLIASDPDVQAALKDANINPASLGVTLTSPVIAEETVTLPSGEVVESGETIPEGTILDYLYAEQIGALEDGSGQVTGSTVGRLTQPDLPPDFTNRNDLLDPSQIPFRGTIGDTTFDDVGVDSSDRYAGGEYVPMLSGPNMDERIVPVPEAPPLGDDADETDQSDSGSQQRPTAPDPKADDTPKDDEDAAAPTGLAKEIADLQAKLEKDRETDKYLALAQAGLALMSSKDPTLLGAVGEAGVSGLTAYREAQDRYQEGVTDLINAKAKLQKSSGTKTEFTANQMLQRANELRKLIADGMGTEQDNIRNAFLADMLEQRALNMGGGGLGMFDVATQE